jgi:hypothetical protein
MEQKIIKKSSVSRDDDTNFDHYVSTVLLFKRRFQTTSLIRKIQYNLGLKLEWRSKGIGLMHVELCGQACHAPQIAHPGTP